MTAVGWHPVPQDNPSLAARGAVSQGLTDCKSTPADSLGISHAHLSFPGAGFNNHWLIWESKGPASLLQLGDLGRSSQALQVSLEQAKASNTHYLSVYCDPHILYWTLLPSMSYWQGSQDLWWYSWEDCPMNCANKPVLGSNHMPIMALLLTHKAQVMKT